MRRSLAILAFSSLALGCGRTVPPALVETTVPTLQPVAAVDTDSLEAAAELHQGRPVAQWSQRLKSHDGHARHEASVALGQLSNRGLQPLLAGMRDRSWEVRLTCLQAVHRPVLVNNARETLPVVAALLDDPNSAVRQQAACRLGWYGTDARAALSRLERVANNDPHPDVRSAAADAVVNIQETLPDLVRLLGDRNPQIRARAAGCVADFGKRARSAEPMLRHLAHSDEHEEVRVAAAGALAMIR